MNVQDIEKIASDLTKYVTEIAKQYGPKAWDIVCNVKRAQSIGELLWGLCWIILFCVSLWSAGFMRRWFKKCEEEDLAEYDGRELTAKEKQELFNNKMCAMREYTQFISSSAFSSSAVICAAIFSISGIGSASLIPASPLRTT